MPMSTSKSLRAWQHAPWAFPTTAAWVVLIALFAMSALQAQNSTAAAQRKSHWVPPVNLRAQFQLQGASKSVQHWRVQPKRLGHCLQWNFGFAGSLCH
jgi:hypothetical protein